MLFGSRKTRRDKPRLGVIGDTQMPLADFYALEERLDALPKQYKIDCVDVNPIRKRFRANALSTEKVING